MRVIEGAPGMFDVLAFGAPTQAAIDYVKHDMARAATVLTDFGRSGLQLMHNVFERFHSDDALRKARELTRKATWLFQSDVVQPLMTLADLQSAQPVMQRYLMADPELRVLYQRQEIDGYSSTYVDVTPGVIGTEHYDYRRVRDGMINFDIDPNAGGEEEVTWCEAYPDELLEGDAHLDVDQKHDIELSWYAQRFITKHTDNDTSSLCGDQRS